MTVDRAKALTPEHDGHTFYFCSEHCRNQFQTDPDRHPRRGERTPEGTARDHVDQAEH